jgi:hypothetical protein
MIPTAFGRVDFAIPSKAFDNEEWGLSSHEFRHINIDIFDEIWSECEMPH